MTAPWPEPGPGLNDFGGDWDRFVDDCYVRYRADFYDSSVTWPIAGQPFKIKRNPLADDGRCHTFWHIVTEGDIEDERLPALDRCECIGWPRMILDEFAQTYPDPSSGRIAWWLQRRGSEDRFVIAVADFSYVVVVADRKKYVLLWTAFPVEHRHRRRKFQREFEDYWGSHRSDKN